MVLKYVLFITLTSRAMAIFLFVLLLYVRHFIFLMFPGLEHILNLLYRICIWMMLVADARRVIKYSRQKLLSYVVLPDHMSKPAESIPLLNMENRDPQLFHESLVHHSLAFDQVIVIDRKVDLHNLVLIFPISLENIPLVIVILNLTFDGACRI